LLLITRDLSGRRAPENKFLVARVFADFPEDTMANTSSAKKAVRKIARRTAVNRSRRSQMRTYVKKVEEALASGDQAAAAAAFDAAQPIMMRAAQKGILHKNTASRKISRLSARVKALAK
jgi:small subunit ribosomal protein S20